MTATEYEQQAHRTIAGHAAENIPYLGFGLMAEAGEVADKIELDNNEIFFVRGNCFQFRDNIVDELGDVLWFVAMLARRLGVSLEEVMRRNLDKLADRQNRGVIIGDGDKR